MRVRFASPLHSYTGQREEVEATGATLAELLRDLDRRYPGLRFRVIDEQDGIRPHLRIFVNRVAVRRLDVTLRPDDVVHVLQSLSGG